MLGETYRRGEEKSQTAGIMDPIHSEVNARCLVALILDKRLDEANNVSEKRDP